MKIYEFLILSVPEQYQMIWDTGIHIDTVMATAATYQLYSLNDFYVELIYDPAGNAIKELYAFKGGERLEKYLPNQ